MKRYLTSIIIALLCFGALSLTACSNSSTSSESASASADVAASAAATASYSASAPESSSSAVQSDPAENFVGEWHLAAVIQENLVIAGDISSSNEDTILKSIVLNRDGSGFAILSDDSLDVTWDMEDEDTIVLKTPDMTEDIAGINLWYYEGDLYFIFNESGVTSAAVFTKSGTYDKMPTITPDALTPAIDTEALVGTWTLCGGYFGGISIYGTSSELADFIKLKDGAPTTLIFNDDGSASLFGVEGTFRLDSDGVVLVSQNDGQERYLLISMFGNDVAVRYPEEVGSGSIFQFERTL